MILDQAYLGDLADQRESALELAAELDGRPEPARVPSAVIWEAFTGVGNAFGEQSDALRAAYERLLASRSSIDLDPTVARRAGILNGEHLQSDSVSDLDDVDSIVAAHALLLNEPVVSNDEDFQAVDGLDVVTY
ncbi:MAG: PIN domain-containing protein [Halobaculum sp.]